MFFDNFDKIGLPSVLFLYSSFFALFCFLFFSFFSLYFLFCLIFILSLFLFTLPFVFHPLHRFSITLILNFNSTLFYFFLVLFNLFFLVLLFFFCFTYLKILSARPPGFSLGQSSLDVTTNWGQDTSSNTWHNSLAHYLGAVVFFPSITDIVSNDYIDIFFLFANERSPGINDFFSDVSY